MIAIGPKGASHLRRVSIKIHSVHQPEVAIPGYLVLHEVGEKMLSFFSTKKFRPEDELLVDAGIEGKATHFKLHLAQCNEQISSGRVMNAVPVEGEMLPTRTFFRCFAKVLEKKVEGQVEGQTDQAAPVAEAAAPTVDPAAVLAEAKEAAPAAEPVVAEVKAEEAKVEEPKAA